jgi:hypothetical protein
MVWAIAPPANHSSGLQTDAGANLQVFTFADASTARSVAITSYSPQRQVRWTLASNDQGKYGAMGRLGPMATRAWPAGSRSGLNLALIRWLLTG